MAKTKMVTKKDVTFSKAFASVPHVFTVLGGSMNLSSSAAGAYAGVQVSASSVTKNGFSIYLANNATVDINVAVRWGAFA